MTTVALIGPDGAGKTTVARKLADVLPVPVRYLYMGVSTDSSNVMLPTTRIIAARIRSRRDSDAIGQSQVGGELRSTFIIAAWCT